MGIPDHLTCLLRICMQVKKQQLEPNMEQQTGSKSGKEYARVQPQWIQGIRRGDGVGEERFIYLEIKREIRKE